MDRRQIVSNLEDINGDGKIERNEVKQNVRMAGPRHQGEFLKNFADLAEFEMSQFKDMMRDCNKDNLAEDSITDKEGMECLQNFVR